MKISPVAHGSGSPGQALGSVDIGRTASPMKLARAKAIANGQVVTEEEQPQSEQKQNVRSIKMHTQRSTNREEYAQDPVLAAAPAEVDPVSSASVSSEAVVEETKPLSPQFAALAKQKRAVQLERAQLEKEKAEFASKAPQVSAEELVKRLKSQPLSVLQEYDISYDQLTEALLSNEDGSSQKIRELEAKLSAVEQNLDKKFTERDSQSKQSALNEMRKEADMLAREGDTYELIRETGSAPKVIELIERTFDKSGEILDVAYAMQLVEDELLNENLKFAKLKKVQGKLTPEPPAQTLQTQQPQMRTLTNRDSATTQLSRRQRAMAAFAGTKR